MDVDNITNDGGISPKNICQTCIEKLQLVFEFKWKSHESDKYIKQIITHSTDETADITPYNPAPLNESYYVHDDEDDEDSLLQPINYNFKQDFGIKRKQGRPPKSNFPQTSIVVNGIEWKKGQRHGMFVCHLCRKSFKYVKPYKNHLKIHRSSPNQKPLSYYKKRKLAMLGEGLMPNQSSSHEQNLLQKLKPAAFNTPVKSKFKAEPQAQYDSLSPYNSPAPFAEDDDDDDDNDEDEIADEDGEPQNHNNTRDSSPDFGEFMLNSSQQLLNGSEVDDEEEELLVEQSPSVVKGRNSKKSSDDADLDYLPKRPGRPKKMKLKTVAAKKTAPVIAPEVTLERRNKVRSTIEPLEVTSPPRKTRPGPLSRTRMKPATAAADEDVQIEGFSTVDISKMLKSKKVPSAILGKQHLFYAENNC